MQLDVDVSPPAYIFKIYYHLFANYPQCYLLVSLDTDMGIVLIYFLAFRVCVTLLPAAAVGPRDMLVLYITYNSVSKPTPWAVAGPHGQLASFVLPKMTFF